MKKIIDLERNFFKKDFLFFSGVFILYGIVSSIVLPIIPIDETRYLSVAWEMYWRKSFLVPILNGAPYSHKTPLFFWLIHLSWSVFGVNGFTPRIIVLLFSFGSVYAAARISRMLGGNYSYKYCLYILPSFLFWLLWSVSVMFDVILVFWFLLAVYFSLKYFFKPEKKYILLSGLSVGMGLLSKGPVILIYLLPVYFFLFFKRKSVGLKGKEILYFIFISVFTGISIFSLWFFPALYYGGQEYRNSILFEQTMGRVVNSFAHKRPFYWYIKTLPFLLAPIIFIEGFYKMFKSVKKGFASDLFYFWVVFILIIFSLISSKQIYYLLPLLPMFSIFISSEMDYENIKSTKYEAKVWGMFLILFGMFFIFLPFLKQKKEFLFFNIHIFVFPLAGIIYIVLGWMLLKKHFLDLFSFIKTMYLISVSVVLILIMSAFFSGLLKKYDLREPSEYVNLMMSKGKKIAFIGKYHNEFGFLGRIRKKIIELNDDPNLIKKFVNGNPNTVIVESLSIKNKDKADIIRNKSLKYWYYRGEALTVWNGKDYLHYWVPVGY